MKRTKPPLKYQDHLIIAQHLKNFKDFTVSTICDLDGRRGFTKHKLQGLLKLDRAIDAARSQLDDIACGQGFDYLGLYYGTKPR